MKKNKMMRIASCLLIAVLISTCAISSTFAKYVTSDSSADTARVAKFGVVITAANNSNFKENYTYDSNAEGKVGTLAVNVDTTGTNLVAPGTKDDTGITFTISGTPEVATKIDIAMTVTSDIYVKNGEHLNWTTGGDDTDNFAVANTATGTIGGTATAAYDGYYPVVFTLKQGSTVVATGNLNTIETAVEAYANTAYYAPNTNLGATFTLTWEWVFGGNDTADTLLGNVAAGTTTDANVSTSLNYNITFTVTQVD